MLASICHHLCPSPLPVVTAAGGSVDETAYSVERPALRPLGRDTSPELIVEQLRTVGCALLPSIISPPTVARLGRLLSGYDIGLSEELQRSDPLLSKLAGPHQRGADVVGFGQKTEGVKSELLGNIFNRDPDWLELVDPSPVIEVADLILGDTCHLVTQKAWRNGPGHDSGGSFHVDELFVEGLPEELASDPRYEPPIHIITALTYLVDVGPELCPTYVVPQSFRSGRRPHTGETSWRDNTPMVVIAKAGDTLLFRSDVWHSGGLNVTSDTTRLLCETVYGARKVAQKFWPYVEFKLNPATRAAATERQMRLLGVHGISNYG